MSRVGGYTDVIFLDVTRWPECAFTFLDHSLLSGFAFGVSITEDVTEDHRLFRSQLSASFDFLHYFDLQSLDCIFDFRHDSYFRYML